jgi:hypothetical protein
MNDRKYLHSNEVNQRIAAIRGNRYVQLDGYHKISGERGAVVNTMIKCVCDRVVGSSEELVEMVSDLLRAVTTHGPILPR